MKTIHLKLFCSSCFSLISQIRFLGNLFLGMLHKGLFFIIQFLPKYFIKKSDSKLNEYVLVMECCPTSQGKDGEKKLNKNCVGQFPLKFIII